MVKKENQNETIVETPERRPIGRPRTVETVGPTCSVDGCDRAYFAKGMCRRHYSRARHESHILGRPRVHPFVGDACSVDGCNDPYFAGGLCARHYKRAWRQHHYHRADNGLCESST